MHIYIFKYVCLHICIYHLQLILYPARVPVFRFNGHVFFKDENSWNTCMNTMHEQKKIQNERSRKCSLKIKPSTTRYSYANFRKNADRCHCDDRGRTF